MCREALCLLCGVSKLVSGDAICLISLGIVESVRIGENGYENENEAELVFVQ